MDDYPSNSHRQKTSKEAPKKPASEKAEEPKKVEKVTSGEVVRRKKPLGKRASELFFGSDTKGVFAFVVLDVMVPAAKDMLADAVSQGVERKLFGEARSSSRRTGKRPGGNNGFVSYNRYSPTPHEGVRSEQRSVSRRAKTTHDFDEIILATRGEAEEVIDRMFDLVSLYETATVADLYELVGVTGSYTDDKWGWTELRGAGVSRTRNGYLLDLPRPEPID